MTLHLSSAFLPITKKTFTVALQTIKDTEENHAYNVTPLIGDMSKDADAMRELLKDDKELINKEFDHEDIQDIEWQIELIEAMAEMKSLS
jgi:hypothetical protein|tara:strand:+ start:1382 stop:1651 length:270 start_codon:yes stop_codon:yes gene_type:complete